MSSTWDGSNGPADSEEWDLDSDVRRSFGRYELITKLGSGGMANVYLARARGPGGFTKLAAVKCIHPHLARDETFIEMFLDEARIAAAIHHPNVCSAFDFGEVDGIYYLAMDYLSGESWSRVAGQMEAFREMEAVADDPPAPGERLAFVARIVADAALGLHAAHEAVGPDGKPLGVVHRDIALPNLFLRYDGQVQVVDFGCAKAAGRIFETEYGKVRGHIAYMAPEILKGWEADRRSDVWSLGVALWELLACQRLFRRTNVHDSMFAIVSEEVPPLSTIAPSVPPELDAIVARALEKDRDDRYATALEMASDLMAFVRQSGHPMGLADLERWMRRLFPGARERVNRLLEGLDTPAPSKPARPPRRRPEYPTVREKKSPLASQGDSELDVTTIAGTGSRSSIRPRLSWSPPWWPLRMSPRSVAIAAAALTVMGLGPVVLGDAGPHTDASTTDVTSTTLVRSSHPERQAPGEPAATAIELAPGHAISIPDESSDGVLAASTTDEGQAEAAREAQAPREGKVRRRARTGRVNVLTPDGWANVMLGSRQLGPTPGQFTLPAGRHRLHVVSGDGATERWVTVQVRPGDVTRVVIDDL